MIHLTFSHWWLLLVLAIILLVIVGSTDGGSGYGAGIAVVFVAIICLAVFLIALAFLVGLHIAH